jgi:four helix bundle protein
MRDGLDALEERTRKFAVEVLRLCRDLEREPGLKSVASQLGRAAGSVASNHRAMRRARHTREFAAKLQIVNEEADECPLWLQIADDLCPRLSDRIKPLLKESRELRAIFAKARKTTKQRLGT